MGAHTVDAQKARRLLIGQGRKNLTAVTFYFTVYPDLGCHGDQNDKVQLFYCFTSGLRSLGRLCGFDVNITTMNTFIYKEQ